MSYIWLRGIAVDSALFALIAAGFWFGIGWAANVAVFVMWFGVVLATLGVFSINHVIEESAGEKYKAYQSKVWRWYDALTDIAMVLTFAALEYFGLAFCMALSKLFFKAVLYHKLDEHHERR